MTGRPGGITILMHERKAGYANNGWSMAGLANKAWGEGVRIEAGIKVTGLRLVAGAVTAVETNEGTVKLETLVVGVGPWIKYLWAMLDPPKKISVNHNGERHDNVPLRSDINGKLVSDRWWGIYYQPDVYLGGVQGGGLPYKVNADADDVKVAPYGAEWPEFVVGDDFIDMWCSALELMGARSPILEPFRFSRYGTDKLHPTSNSPFPWA